MGEQEQPEIGTLIARIERRGFRTEEGLLTDCQDWRDLKELIRRLDRLVPHLPEPD